MHLFISHHRSVFGICDLLQSCRSHRETIIGVFQNLQNMNSDLNSGFQYEKFNFRLLSGTRNFGFEDGFGGFGTWEQL